MRNVIYQTNINAIGGVETVLWNIVRKYSDRDITILYCEGADEQLYRLSQFAHVVKFTGQKIKCDRLFVNYGWDEIKDSVECDDKYWLVHANYDYLASMDEKINIPDGFKVCAVSDFAGKHCGKPYEVCYNPVVVQKQDCLLFVSATRLASDKGNIKARMETLASALDNAGIKYIWLVFTNSKKDFNNNNIVKVKSRLDITPFIQKADFVVQLSDSEACCMTALESLSLGTPMIVTDIESFHEQGLDDSNAIFLDFDMGNVDSAVQKVKKKFNFKFTPKEDKWGELLLKGNKKEVIPMKIFKVKATAKFLEGGGVECKDIGRIPYVGEEFNLSEERANLLREKGYVDIVEEIKRKAK